MDTFVKKKKKKRVRDPADDDDPRRGGHSTPTKVSFPASPKCSFSPRSFYKSRNDLKPDLIGKKRSSDLKCSEPPKKQARASDDRSVSRTGLVQIPIVRNDRQSSGPSLPGKGGRNMVSSLLKTDPKLGQKASLVKIPKLPHFEKASKPSSSASRKNANNEAVNNVTEIMTHARVSPVKVEPCAEGSLKPQWPGFGSCLKSFQDSRCSSNSSTSTSPSKLLRPPVLNVVTPPTQVSVKQEPRTTSFTSSSTTTTTATAVPKPASFLSNNPFLPTDSFKKTSFLFGRDSDFQTAAVFDSDDVAHIIYVGDDEDDDESSDDSIDLNSKSGNVDGGVKASEHIFGTGLFSSEDATNDSKHDLHNFLFNTFALAKTSELKPASEPKTSTETVVKPTTEPPPSCNKIRFPAVQGSNNLIECKWRDCESRFTTYGKLSDHLKVSFQNFLIPIILWS